MKINNSRDAMLVTEARRLTSLQHKRRALRLRIRQLDKDIKLTRKHMHALMREDKANPAWDERMAETKLFG